MSRPPGTGGSGASSEPDISFEATVRGERLRFEEEPRTAVGFPGAGERESSSRSERTNLPYTVAPGQEYRDILVHYRLATRLIRAAEGDPGDEGDDEASDHR
ncbi:hypothetical protein [Streptomyces palmae]|uniref:Uncharacterized protein n=1 Tax=Streptomyces palmae TaxID=1701085 RepID=A0A4Z0HA45_9ACTN|nr:hypothetical protein [Streptomyces palmae]TGB07615.1 hypothetical protein E4099_16755 [Streptomyces palmae]